jgi:hypothetical protein
LFPSFQPTHDDSKISEKILDLPSVNTVISQVLEVSPEPDPLDCTAEHVGRIADLEG